MANETKEISEIVKKCKILLLDIEGTTTSISFVKDKLFPYAEENVKKFLENQWDQDNVKEAVSALRKLALEDQENKVDGAVSIPGEDASKDEQIEGLVSSVKWQMSQDRKAAPLKTLQGLIWKEGYDCGDIKGHVYDDVLPALEQWHAVEGQKVYIYSSGSVQAQKLLFGQSSAGDLLKYIDGHFDTAVGAKQEASSYTNIVEKIGCKPEEILFLTDILKEAEAAAVSGLQTALVVREGNSPLPEGEGTALPTLTTLAQLTVATKRKTDPQNEQPAKVQKTDIDADVKAAVETKQESSDEINSKQEDKIDKMEVDNDTESVEETKLKELPAVETIVEEVTEVVEDMPECDIEPVVEEKMEEVVEDIKNSENDNPKAESEAIPTETIVQECASNDSAEQAKAEETPPIVVTEIEELPNDKQILSEVGEIIDDIEPVIEEPASAEDMEELKNAGEVLEKECDEILSKVQDVTNLDNIPIKPLLNPISEEMETENTDSNDIVDRILDTELELEMEQRTEIDLKTVSEIAEDVKASAEKTITETVSAQTTEENKEQEKQSPEKASEDSRSENTKVQTENNAEESKEASAVTDKTETVLESKETAAVTEKTEAVLESKETPPVTDKKEAVLEAEVKNNEEMKDTTEESQVVLEAEVKNNEEVKDTTEESQVNSKTNGNVEPVTNGDASKDEELSARLSVENGKAVVNGSNGDAAEEKGKGDSAVEGEVTEVKVKTVAANEPPAEPTDQPVEA